MSRRYWSVSYLFRRLCWVAAIFVCIFVACGPATADEDECALCRTLAMRLLDAPGVPACTLGDWHANLHNRPDAASRACYKLRRQGSLTAGELHIDHANHAWERLSIPPDPARAAATDTQAWDMLRDAAFGFAQAACSDAPDVGPLTLVGLGNVDRAGLLEFSFAVTSDVGSAHIRYPYTLRVQVAVTTGEVREARVGRRGLREALTVSPSIGAIKDAKARAAAELGLDVQTARCSEVTFIPMSVPGWVADPCWQFVVTPDLSETPLQDVQYCFVTLAGDTVHDVRVLTVAREDLARLLSTGLPLYDPIPIDRRGLSALQPPHDVDDHWPVWTADGSELLFVSRRPRAGAAWWNRVPSVVKVDLRDGEVYCVHGPFDGRLEAVSYARGLVAAYNVTRHEVQFCRLSDGAYLARGYYPDRHFDWPFLCADGATFTYSAARRHGDEDIFIDRIRDDFRGLSEHRRICRLEGVDRHPVFLPDNKRICFAHTPYSTQDTDTASGEQAATALYVVNVSDRDGDVTRPSEVVSGFTEVERITPFGDRASVLVADTAGLWVVDVDTKTKEALELVSLHDPEIPDGPPLRVREPAISPDGKHLAFSAFRDPGEMGNGTGSYIYVCDLDGSNLRRVTPLDDGVVNAYTYPLTGKSAFEVMDALVAARRDHEYPGR